MKHVRALLILAVVFGFVCSRPFLVLAEEMEMKEDMEDTALGEPSIGTEDAALPSAMPEEDEVAVLTEAAVALDATHPELAAKLRALAANEMNAKTEEAPVEAGQGPEVQ